MRALAFASLALAASLACAGRAATTTSTAAAVPTAAPPQAPSPIARISQPALVTQYVGATEITVRFNRPTARGRELFGALVKYGEVWHPGADEASTIRFSRDVTFGGSLVRAGTYSIWTIPTPAEWTFILSSAAPVFHRPYPEGRDVLRIQVTPKRAAHMESMAYYFPFADRTKTALVLHWGDVMIEVPIEVRQ
jgi:hypothetical protein